MPGFNFPYIRLRRNRLTQPIRELIAENNITINDLVYPMFIIDGDDIKDPIKELPNQYRFSIDKILIELNTIINLGIKAIALFPIIKENLKDDKASNSYRKDGLIQRAIKSIKDKFPQLLIFTDIALDPYTNHGHDGIIDNNGYVLNDVTNEILVKQALSHASSGADFVCPSDMMDGRIGKIRESLEENNFSNCGIMAYSVKYASSFYGPFRNAVRASGNINKDKATYQMNPANIREALLEIEIDINEGADIIMIKPGLPYLDIVKTASEKFNRPIAIYHVSGEYAMLKLAAANNLINYDNAIIESMLCCKRAGADIIWTYSALDVAKLLG
jgi:porphobilinogen synthase